MRPPPHFKPELRKLHGLLVGNAKNVKRCRAPGWRTVVIDRVRHRRIMVARQYDDRQSDRRDHGSGAVEQFSRQSVAVERIARQHHHVRPRIAGSVEHARNPRRPVAPMQASGVVMVQMQIGTMDDDDVFGGQRPKHDDAA